MKLAKCLVATGALIASVALSPTVIAAPSWDVDFSLNYGYNGRPAESDYPKSSYPMVAANGVVYAILKDDYNTCLGSWNSGTKTWTAIAYGTGFRALYLDGNDLYVGGTFTEIWDLYSPLLTEATNIAKFNLLDGWSRVNSVHPLPHEVSAIVMDAQKNLYVGLDVPWSAEPYQPALMKLESGVWTVVGGGLGKSCVGSCTVKALATDGANIYVGGRFEGASGPVACRDLVKWNSGGYWSQMGPGGVNWRQYDWGGPIVNSIAVSGTSVIVTGSFDTTGPDGLGYPPYGLIRFNTSGTKLESPGLLNWRYGYPGTGYGCALATYNNKVYLAGYFDTIGGTTNSSQSGVHATGIAQWNGSTWAPLGAGINDYTDPTGTGCDWGVGYCVAADATGVYTLGRFNKAGDLDTWNGARWSEPRGVKSVSCGYTHSIAVTPAGGVYTWGGNDYGQLGNWTTAGQLSPIQISGTFAGVAAGCYSSYAWTAGGTLYAWGDNTYGQLGIGSFDTQYAPVVVSGIQNVVSVKANFDHCLALTSDGKVYAWGNNYNGQLGDGTTDTQLTPTLVSSLANETIVSIAAGCEWSLASTADGRVYAWGYNGDCQLGDGTTIGKLTPQLVPLSSVASVVAGYYGSSFAIMRDGTIQGWGYNVSGQLGNGTTTTQPTPVTVTSLNNVADLSTGGGQTIAVLNDGKMYAWGYNGSGCLGDGTQAGQLSPVRVNTTMAGSKVAAGYDFTAFISADSRVFTFGDDYCGQLGNGTTGWAFPNPAPIPNW